MSATTLQLARDLAARLAVEQPELLPAVARLLERLAPCQAGAGFTCVRWHGAAYTFGPMQARIVRVLWEAWERGVPDVDQRWLLNEAGSDSDRLLDVFRGHPAWGAMIAGGAVRGTYRLADPAWLAARPPEENAPAGRGRKRKRPDAGQEAAVQ